MNTDACVKSQAHQTARPTNILRICNLNLQNMPEHMRLIETDSICQRGDQKTPDNGLRVVKRSVWWSWRQWDRVQINEREQKTGRRLTEEKEKGRSTEDAIYHSQSTTAAGIMKTDSGSSCQHEKLISILSSPTIRNTPATCLEIDLEHLARGWKP